MKINLKDSNKVFDVVKEQRFEYVQEEIGWQILFDGVWIQKKDCNKMKRLYASKNAAKDRVEMEFIWEFNRQFDKENKELEDQANKASYPNGWGSGINLDAKFGIFQYNNLKTKSFRAFMNYLYEEGRIEYKQYNPNL